MYKRILISFSKYKGKFFITSNRFYNQKFQIIVKKRKYSWKEKEKIKIYTKK